jgi:hypothetical protein
MKILLTIFALLIIWPAALSGQVQHAPSIAECQADQRVWLPKIEATLNHDTLPSFLALTLWQQEMADCEKVDPKNTFQYMNTNFELEAVQSRRMLDFRHSTQHARSVCSRRGAKVIRDCNWDAETAYILETPRGDRGGDRALELYLRRSIRRRGEVPQGLD